MGESRDDAGELLAIRGGALSFDELLAHADAIRGQMQAAALASSLPEDVDRSFVDALVFELAVSRTRP